MTPDENVRKAKHDALRAMGEAVDQAVAARRVWSPLEIIEAVYPKIEAARRLGVHP